MNDKMNCGVYRILHRESGKVYIGSSTNLKVRLADHKNKLRQNRHVNSYLQNAYNKYGEDAFDFQVILICDPVNNIMYEQKFMDFYKCYEEDFGYNINPTAGSPLGRVVTDATKLKLSQKLKGRVISQEARDKASITLTGRVFTEEHKRKIGDKSRGRKHTNESKIKLSEINTGKKLSQEVKDKISKKNKGKVVSDETKLKMSEAASGKVFSEEHRNNLSQSQKGKIPWNKGKVGIESPKKGIPVGPDASKRGWETRRANKLKKEREIWWAGQSMMFEAQVLLQNTNFNI